MSTLSSDPSSSPFFDKVYKLTYNGIVFLLWGGFVASSFLWALRVQGVLSGIVWFFYALSMGLTCGSTNNYETDLTRHHDRTCFWDATVNCVTKRRLGYVMWWLALVPFMRARVLIGAVKTNRMDIFKKCLPRATHPATVQKVLLTCLNPVYVSFFSLALGKAWQVCGTAATLKILNDNPFFQNIPHSKKILWRPDFDFYTKVCQAVVHQVNILSAQDQSDLSEHAPEVFLVCLKTLEAFSDATDNDLSQDRLIKEQLLLSPFHTLTCRLRLLEELKIYKTKLHQVLLPRLPHAQWKYDYCFETINHIEARLQKQTLVWEINHPEASPHRAKPSRKM